MSSETLATMPESGAIGLATFFFVIMFFGSFTNSLIIITLLKYRKVTFTQPGNLLVCSLAIGDFLVVTLACPLGFASAIVNKWTSGHSGCVWYAFITTWVGLTAILQLTAVAYRRAHTLASPVAPVESQYGDLKFIIASWIIAFVTSLFPIFGWSAYVFEGFGLHCSILWTSAQIKHLSYSVFLLLFFFVIPVIIMVASYIRMFLVVKNLSSNAKQLWGQNAQWTQQSYLLQKRLTKQLLFVTTGFLVAWSPYAVACILKIFTNIEFAFGSHELPSLFTKTSNIMYYYKVSRE
uniref:Opsin n=1 Tax=Renilla koellikeri TaxID=6135 RepID=A0A346FU13_RENKO|nr:opsin [Renilla koellikeri]